MTPQFRRRTAYVLLAIASIAALLAVWALLTGGFRVYVLGVPISVRGEHRAAYFAIILALVGYLLIDPDLRVPKSAARMLDAEVVALGRFRASVSRLLWLIPLAAAAIVLWIGLAFGTRSAGGADTYGYVSQAKLWLRGDLHVRDNHPVNVPWPQEEWTFTPLGYKPSTDHTLVPTYSPGLPLLMALSERIVGPCGPFMIAPLCAALLVWLTWVLGVRVSSRPMGAVASLCIATCPTVLIMTMSPMSDVPAATFWTASLVLACRRDPLSTAAAGAAAGVAILIRPNLAPLAVFPMALSMAPWLRTGVWPAARRAIVFAFACAPAVLFIGWVFNSLYGSPFESGYGRASTIYRVDYVAANLGRYPRWLWETQGPVPFLFLLTPWLATRRAEANASLRLILFGFAAAVFGAYVAYEPFEDWWYLRFLLPAFPVMFVLAFDAARRLGSRFGPTAGATAALLAAAVGLFHGAAVAHEKDMIHIAEGEQKFADAARFVAIHLPPGAVVLAMLHSGSVRLYSGHLTLRYDVLEPAHLDQALEYLRREGREPYLLLEDWEVPVFRERFAGQLSASAVDAVPLAALPDRNVLLFSTDVRQPTSVTTVIPGSPGCQVAPR